MAMNFGSYIAPPNNGGMPFMNFGGQTQQAPIPQPSGIQVIPASNRQVAEDYPLSAGTTGFFFNYNGRRIYIKTQNTNGLSYDMEELIMLTPQEFQQLQQAALTNQDQRHSQQTNGDNSASFVPVEKFDELAAKVESLQKQLEEFIK